MKPHDGGEWRKVARRWARGRRKTPREAKAIMGKRRKLEMAFEEAQRRAEKGDD